MSTQVRQDRSTRCCGLGLGLVWSLQILLGGCSGPRTALVDGKKVPRLTQEFVGQPFSIRHKGAHPRPGGPSGGLRDNGGDIFGQVCGVDVSFEVEHVGDHVQLTGTLDNEQQSQIQVRDDKGQRAITGQLGGHAVDLRLRSNQIVGRVGQRYVDLTQQGDAISGELAMAGTDEKTTARVNGRDYLWAMPAADQGAVLPLLLMCYVAQIGSLGRSPMEVGFGGKMGMMPRGSSELQNAH